MAVYWQRFTFGALAGVAVFYLARRGMIGTEAQNYANKAATTAIIEGVPF